MLKKLALLVCLCPLLAFAQEDYVPENCDDMTDPMMHHICDIARENQTPMYLTGIVLLTADVEATAKKCNFKLTGKFEKRKERLLADGRFVEMYEKLLEAESKEKEVIQQDKMFCKDRYSLFGPENAGGKLGGMYQ